MSGSGAVRYRAVTFDFWNTLVAETGANGRRPGAVHGAGAHAGEKKRGGA